MSKTPFLPLGTIVILKGTLKKLMIVNRANIVDDTYFDYGAVLYPEGMVDNDLAYFNQDDLLKVVSEGFSDEDNDLMVAQLEQAKKDYQEVAEKQTTNTAETPAEEADPFSFDF